MTGPGIEKLNQAIEQAAASFNRLVLLAGPGESGKTSLLRQVSDLRGCPFVNVNLKLSQSLLELLRSKRPRQVDRIFGELIDECEGELIVLDDLEVLFVSVEAGRTTILDGWGIHMSFRGGWVWNIWSRDCVVLRLRKGILRVGTDDADKLSEFLHRRLSDQEPT